MYKLLRQSKCSQQGLGLVEISIWLMFAGVILGTTVWTYYGAERRATVNRNAETIVSLVHDARFMYGRGNTGFSLLNTPAEAIDSGLIPARMVKQDASGTPTAVNSYGGEIALQRYSTLNDYALLGFGGVPASHCVALVTAVESLMDGIAVTSAAATVSSDSEFTVKLKSTSADLNAEVLQSSCNGSASVHLQFKFFKE